MPWLVGVVAALAAAPLVDRAMHRLGPRVLPFEIALKLAVLLVLVVGIVPDAIRDAQWLAALAIGVGALVPSVAERVGGHGALGPLPVAAGLALCVHGVVDGVAITTGAEAGLLVVLHTVPVAALVWRHVAHEHDAVGAWAVLVAGAVGTVAGYVVGVAVEGAIVGVAEGLVGGVLLHMLLHREKPEHADHEAS